MRRPALPKHWMLITTHQGDTTGRYTYYHSTDGSPLTNRGYKVKIEAQKRFDSWGIEFTQKLGLLTNNNVKVLRLASNATAPQYCQQWVVDVLKTVEAEGIVKAGTAAVWKAQVEPRPR